MPDLSRYEWVDDHDAMCVAVIRGRTPDEVIEAYGGEVGDAAPATLDRAWDLGQHGDRVLFVGPVGDQVLAVEDNGWQGSRPEVLRELSGDQAAALSVFWNVNADSQVALAVDGKLVTHFEVLSPEQRWGSDPDRLLPQLRAAGFRTDGDGDEVDDDGTARALSVMAALTGVAVTREVLAGPFRAVLLTPLPEDLPGRDALAGHFVRHQDPELAAELDRAAADEPRLRAAAVAAARATMAVAGIDREPLLLAALDGAARGGVGPVDRRSPLGRLLGSYVRESNHTEYAPDQAASEWATWRMLAGNSVWAALAPDPLIAAWEAASQGRVYLPRGAPVRAAVLATLRS
jgi:hypothetical protein